MKQQRAQEDLAERELFETIKSTYVFALEPEQHAMIVQLRSHLPSISSAERMSLIDSIENAIGQDIEEREYDI